MGAIRDKLNSARQSGTKGPNYKQSPKIEAWHVQRGELLGLFIIAIIGLSALTTLALKLFKIKKWYLLGALVFLPLLIILGVIFFNQSRGVYP